MKIEEFESYLEKLRKGEISQEVITEALFSEKWGNFNENELDSEQLERLYISIVEKYPDLFMFIPKPKQTKGICEIIVRKSALNLGDVPVEQRTRELCIIAIEEKNNWAIINKIPAEFFDESDNRNEKFIQALNEAKKLIQTKLPLSFIPVSKRDRDSCLLAIQRNWEEIKDVPAIILNDETFLNDKNVKSAIEQACSLVIQDWEKIKEFPQQIFDAETYIECAKKHWEALKFIPTEILENSLEELKTPIEEGLAAIKQDGKKIKDFPKQLLNEEVCLSAVKQNINNFEYVPKALLTHQFFLKAMNFIFFRELALGKLQNYKQTTSLSKQECEDIWAGIVGVSGISFLNIPILDRDFSMCSKIAEKCSFEFLKYIKDYKENSSLSEQEYKNVLVTSIRHQLKEGQGDEILNYIPNELIDYELMSELIKKDGLMIKHVVSDKSNRFTEENRKSLYREAIFQNGEALQYLPITERSFYICKFGIEKTPSALRFIQDYTKTTMLNEKEFKEICNTAVNKDGKAIQHVPDKYKNYELYLKSIGSNWEAFEFIKKDYEGENAVKLTEKQFKRLCIAAIEKSSSVFGLIPKKYCDFELLQSMINANAMTLEIINTNRKELPINDQQYSRLCDIAFELDSESLKFLPTEKQNYNAFMTAVSRDGLLLENIQKTEKWKLLEENEIKKIYLEAVRQNSMALKYVDEKYKPFVIETLTPSKILTLDYAAIEYFPKQHNYQDDINSLLSNIEHVVITTGYANDREIADGFSVYANHPKRLGKTIHCGSNSVIEKLLADIHSAQSNNSHPLNIVLLSHASEHVKSMAGLEPNAIGNLVENHHQVNTLTLLGCHTSKAKRLEEEDTMLEQYQAEPQAEYNACGLVLMSTIPDPSTYSTILKKMKWDKNGSTADEVFILVNSGEQKNPTLQLIHLKQNEKEQKHDITPAQLKQLSQLIVKKPNFPFPKSQKQGNNITYYRGGKANEFLTAENVRDMMAIVSDELTKFSKLSSKYKKVKKQYPFLSSATLPDSEKSKLLPSFQKKVIEAVENNPEIERDITVKGYTQILHVDTKEKGMKSVDSYAYTTGYKRAGKPSTYFQGDNINREEAKKYYKKRQEGKMSPKKSEGDTTEEESHFKSIKYKTTPTHKKT